MFPDWLAPLDLAAFGRQHFQKLPYAAAGSVHDGASLLNWQTLDRVLRAEGVVDVLTVARGRMVEVPRPRSLDDALPLLADGVSVVVRGAERHDPGLAQLAESLAACVAGEVHVQLYATPTGTNSYGWHYDFEDVFIAQTAGTKEYFFRANTVAKDRVLGDDLTFEMVRQEKSPLMSARLEPADFLYIPTRWWHFVRCLERSLSISVGIMPPKELRAAKRLPPGWTGERVGSGGG